MGSSHRKYDGLWVITDCGQLMVSPVEQDKSPNSMAFLLSPLVDGWAYYLIYASIFAAFMTFCGVFCEFVTFPLVSWVRCGT